MRIAHWLLVCAGLLLMEAGLAQQGSTPPANDYQQGFQNGFDAGYRDGYERALQDIRARQPLDSSIQAPQVVPGPAIIGGNAVVVPTRPPVRNRGIVIVRAWYSQEGGRRGSGACDLTSRLVGEMNGRRHASIEVTNQLCGDPAPGKRKSLKAVYLCGGEEREAEAYEHRALRLSCE